MAHMSSIMVSVGLCVLILGCMEDDRPAVEPGRAVSIDKHSRSGRKFMYLDSSGQVVYKRRYQDIPVRYRNAVVVIDSRRRKPRKPKKSATQKSEAQRGFFEARRILSQNPPEADPPSTETWTEQQWDKELEREMRELRREQAKH